MELSKVIAAVEIAASRETVIANGITEKHALYHATLDCLLGLLRGQLQLGGTLRTMGVRYSITRGPYPIGSDTDWIAVAMYGTVGAPIRGMEHEAVGLGVMHVA